MIPHAKPPWLGIGGHRQGVVAVVAGTCSINEFVSSQPCIDEGWFCRDVMQNLINVLSASHVHMALRSPV